MEKAGSLVYASLMTFTIENMKHDTYLPLFGGQGVEMITADVDLGSGVAISVSHRADDEPNVWGVDYAMRDGKVLWSNGPGARYLTVHRPNAEIEQALNRWARQM